MSQQKLLYNITSTKLLGVYCYWSSGRNTETNMFEQKFKWGGLTVLHTAQSTWVLFSTTWRYKQHFKHPTTQPVTAWIQTMPRLVRRKHKLQCL